MTVEHMSRKYPPSDPVLVDDPYGGSPVWIITRHEDVGAMLSDRCFVNNTRSLPGGTDLYVEMLLKMGISEHLAPYIAGNLVHLDPPDHTRLRNLVSKAFSARRISALRPRLETITDELIDALPGHADNGVVELMEHFALPLPITVACELLGIPVEDRPKWRDWSSDCTSMDPKRMEPMLAEVAAYVLELAEQRRAEPADDLISRLIQARDEDHGRLSDVELITMVLTLVIAGHETTTYLIGNGIAALLTHPDQLALLRDDPTLMPGAVQELLRWCSPTVTAMLRFAGEDTKIGDTLIRKGERVQGILGSANRDPRRYPRPDRLDITRRLGTTGIPHFAYSYGVHYCLGAPLANLEAEVAFSAIFNRYPNLALAVPPEGLEWKPVSLARQLARLPVTLGT